MKINLKTIPLLFLLWGCPVAAQAQIDLLINILYEINFIFGLEGEPTATETDFSNYPYDLYNDGRYRPVNEPGRAISTKAQAFVYGNDQDFLASFTQLQFSPVSTITLDANYLYFSQDQGLDANATGSLANLTFQYNRLRYSDFYFWWDVGLSHYSEPGLKSMGFSAGTGLTWFVKQPFSLHIGYRFHEMFEPDAGSMSVFDARVQFHIKRYFVAGGYQNLSNNVEANVWTVGGGVYF